MTSPLEQPPEHVERKNHHEVILVAINPKLTVFTIVGAAIFAEFLILVWYLSNWVAGYRR